MFGTGFQSGREGYKLFLRYAVCGQKICDLRFSGCDSSGFIERNNLHAAGFLQGLRCFEENAVLCAKPVANHNRNRRRQSKGARTGDDQYANAACECITDVCTDKQPDHQCDGRKHDHSRNKYSGNFIGKLCYGRLGRRGVTDHRDNLRECCVLADSGRAAL